MKAPDAGNDGVEKKKVRRKYAPKAKTGCITCKIRRVKCDEGKPSCKRCISTGRKCDGYGALPSRTDPASALVPAITPGEHTSTALEKRTLAFFRAKTVPCLSGYFQDLVWNKFVLQLSYSEPTVRHAANALAALHEEKTLKQDASDAGIRVANLQTSFHLQQYCKALNELQKLIESNTTKLDLVLACSLLFIHFESLRGYFVAALAHTENAVRLLNATTEQYDLGLARELMRIDIRGGLYLGVPSSGLPYLAAENGAVPPTFHNLSQARDLLTTWNCRLYSFMCQAASKSHDLSDPQHIPLETLANAHELEEVYTQIDARLHKFQSSRETKLSPREQCGVRHLRARVKMARILSAACLHAETAICDRYIDEFEAIAEICAYILDSKEPTDEDIFSISLDQGMLGPLFFAVTHCRDGHVRRQALTQLERLPKDGPLHATVMMRLAEVWMEYEEELFLRGRPAPTSRKDLPTCADIPEWRRIHSAALETSNSRGDSKLQSVNPVDPLRNCAPATGNCQFPDTYFDDPHTGKREESPINTVGAQLHTRPNGMDGEWDTVYVDLGVRQPGVRPSIGADGGKLGEGMYQEGQVSDAKLREQNSMLFWYATQKAPISVEFAGASLKTNLNIRELNTSLREYCSLPSRRQSGADKSYGFDWRGRVDSPKTPSSPTSAASPLESKFGFTGVQYVGEEDVLPESMIGIATWDGSSGDDEMENSSWGGWS